MTDVNKNFDDEPIKKPEDDTFGVDRLAEAIADCIDGLRDPVGSVIAINGPWGSGKSSVINLVLHHLKAKSPKPNIITFNCWLYRGEEALTLGFFKELYKGLTPILPKIRKVLSKLGSQMAAAGHLLGTVTAPVDGGGTVKVGANLLGNYISDSGSVEGLRNTVYKALDGQDQQFLVIIDDLDRLSPDEVILIFRLIKSVGRLPQITYLISYDREIVEQAITKRYPSEGGKHYLEKMVQAGFEIPVPDPVQLNDMMWNQINKIFKDTERPDDMRLHDILDEAVMPELRTPRDVVRLANTLSITWGAVRGKVNIADFICLEMFRLFRPDLYRVLGGNKSEIMTVSIFNKNPGEYYDQLLFSSEPEEVRERLRDILIFLFPQLRQVWGVSNSFDTEHWLYERRVCDSDHFDTYFRFSPPDMLVSSEKIGEIIRRSDDPEFVKAAFKDALSPTQRGGRSKVFYLLNALISHKDDFSDESVRPFIKTMFSMADELWEDPDEFPEFSLQPHSSLDKLRRLTRVLTLARFDLEKRSSLIRAACESASPGWLAYFICMYEMGHPRHADGFSQSSDEILMTQEHTDEVKVLARQRIRTAKDDGTLVNLPNLPFVLHRWEEIYEGGEVPVRSWTSQILKQDESVGQLAKACLRFSVGTANASPDRLGGSGEERSDAIETGLERIMDLNLFERRLEEVRDGSNVSEEVRENIRRFLEALDKGRQK